MSEYGDVFCFYPPGNLRQVVDFDGRTMDIAANFPLYQDRTSRIYAAKQLNIFAN